MDRPSKIGPPLDSWWMPFTANRQFKAAPRILARAQGIHYFTQDGRPVLDGTAGLWCVNAGHGRSEIADAVSVALRELDYAPPFQMGHPLAFQAAEALKSILPDGFDSIFFVNSGSEAADTALKIARAYHFARGEPERVWLIGRERGYHGVNFGGISVGGIANNRAAFGPRFSPRSITFGTRTTSSATPSRAASRSTERSSPTTCCGSSASAARKRSLR